MHTTLESPVAAAAAPAFTLPLIGTAWLGQSGEFSGLFHTRDGLYALLRLTTADTALTWDDAMAWAKSQGGDLPSRIEWLTLRQHFPHAFEPGWCWSNEEDGSFAWSQYFDFGNQYYHHKSYEGRAVAVRRLPLQSFGPFEVAA